MTERKNILVCTDFSEDANHAFVHALDLAKQDGALLHILHVPHSPYVYCKHIVDEHTPEGAPYGEAFFSQDIADRAEEALREEYGKELDGFENFLLVVRDGAPEVEIIRYARNNSIDEIVMGVVGKHDWDRVERGSTVDNVCKLSRFHVIAVNGRQSSRNVQTRGTA
jgi:nucleotide-binding universal stress UspA family protein